MSLKYDFIVIGGGMAGASIAAALSEHSTVALIEREEMPGYHSTGRSAALYAESYGNQIVRALTTGSRTFFQDPPAQFSDGPLWTKRGSLHIAKHDDLPTLEEVWMAATKFSSTPNRISNQDVHALIPFFRDDTIAGAFVEPDTMDLEVARIHQGYLNAFKRQGGGLFLNAEVKQIARNAGKWEIKTPNDVFIAPVIINAAGAWADKIAALANVEPLGLIPKRRTVILFAPPDNIDSADWPMVVDAGESFYFKPDAGMILASPGDATETEACDAQPEELDVAITVDRLQNATTFPIHRIAHRWAGLRTFAADNTPVVGFAADTENFFWFAGQGGYGIQTAPAMAKLAHALITGQFVPADLAQLGITFDALAPNRLQHKAASSLIATI